VDAFGDHHFFRAAPGDVDQRLRLAQVLGAASDVHGDRRVLRDEIQLVQQLRADEVDRIVDLQALVGQVLHQAQGAGAGVAVDRVEPAAAGPAQGGGGC